MKVGTHITYLQKTSHTCLVTYLQKIKTHFTKMICIHL